MSCVNGQTSSGHAKAPLPADAKGGCAARLKGSRRFYYDKQSLPDGGHLTECEDDVLQLVAGRCDNVTIMGRIGCNLCTVEKHIEHIYRKLRVKTRADAASWLLTQHIDALEADIAELRRHLRTARRRARS